MYRVQPLLLLLVALTLGFCIESFPGGSNGKESASKAGDLRFIPGSGRSPGQGNGYPTPLFLPAKSHGQRSLTVHGVAESDMTE